MNENIEDRLYQLEEDGKSQTTSNDGGFHSGNLREEKCLKPLLEDYIPIGLKTIFNDFLSNLDQIIILKKKSPKIM